MAERTWVHQCPRCRAPRGDAQGFCASCAFDFWGAAAGRSPDAAPVQSRHASLMRPGASESAQTAGTTGWSGPVVSVITGGALAVIGSVMPWISTASAGGELAFSGVDGGGDGWVTVVAGLGIIGFALLARRGADDFNRGAVWLLSLVAFAIFWINLGRVSDAVTGFEANSRGLATAEIGFGLWVIALGAVLALALNIARPRSKGPGGLPNLLPF
jgi:hypothetical protein